MTNIIGLTDEQRSFSEHVGGAFVHACPGAGKTRAIIARLAKIAKTLPPRRGVAILSFTNSAVDEFRERCQVANLEALLEYPSFMGTLDAFVRHFIVLPGCTMSSTTRPIILDSWESLGVEIRLTGQYAFRGDGVGLDSFDPETNVINPDKIRHAGLQNHVRQHQARYQQAAAHRRRNLLSAGYLSTGDARVEMLKLVRDPLRGPALAIALAARFYEVMVDEGQDCNPLDLEILSWLRQHGVCITFVCDPDQAIYGFRHGHPNGLRDFQGTYHQNSQHSLSGNFRSSPAICLLAASLRNTGNVDRAVGECADITHPVIVLTYGGNNPNASIGRIFSEQVTVLGISMMKAIILAHASRVAQRAAGELDLASPNGNSHVEVMARAVSEFWSSAATSRSRENALHLVESLLLDLMGMREEGEHRVRTLHRTGINSRLHRRRALALLTEMPKSCADTDAARIAWIACLHEKIEMMQLNIQPGQTVRGFFRRPSNGQWSAHLQASVRLCLAWSTIHEAKGHEFDAVCVVIPPNRAPENRCESLFSYWENNINDEAKRVIYVGVTRARKLSVLAVPASFADRCIALLTAGNVPHRRVDIH